MTFLLFVTDTIHPEKRAKFIWVLTTGNKTRSWHGIEDEKVAVMVRVGTAHRKPYE